ncbi:SNF7 family domain-containing protein, putative [Eimeria acervulina]|uniref:SNF7 family domain-containing protein, putative n=1 Tax=Eimeria acervulina TaxID=5801 RepID=U6GR65_EIMAC|nr:SNF7 family domain-containing protein, putative [Eimeria acervulina]CDI82037.1 SNF7 family domain-containing protein, putative [Eimeria acervulina]
MFQNIKRNLFGGDSADTLAEAVKEQRRHIARSLRALDRQHQKAEAEQQKLLAQLKAQAVAGVQQQQATQELHRHFTGCAKLLSLANKAADLPTMQLAVKGFTRESQKLGLLDEMLNEVLEDGTAHFGFRTWAALQEDEEETEEEIHQELMEYASIEIERQLPVGCSSAREAPLLGQVQQQQQQQVQQQQVQQQQRQQQQAGRKPKQSLLQKLSCTPRTGARSPWLSKDEAAMAEQLEQRLGSLLR